MLATAVTGARPIKPIVVRLRLRMEQREDDSEGIRRLRMLLTRLWRTIGRLAKTNRRNRMKQIRHLIEQWGLTLDEARTVIARNDMRDELHLSPSDRGQSPTIEIRM